MKVLRLVFRHPSIDTKSWVDVRLTDAAGRPVDGTGAVTGTSPGFVRYATRLSSIPDRLSVRFAYACGPWLDGRAFVPGTSADTSLGSRVKLATGATTDLVLKPNGDQTISDHVAPGTPGLCAKIAVERGDIGSPDSDYSFDAETTDGRRLSPIPVTTRPAGRTVQVFYFDAPPEKIARFLLRTRPVREIVFNDIPLKPAGLEGLPAVSK